MAQSKLPLSVRVTDTFHRATVLGLVGISVFGIASVFYNVYMNSDFARRNRNSLEQKKNISDSGSVGEKLN